MAKSKFVVSLMLAALLMLPVSAEVKLDDVTTPKDIFYRLGTTDTPENKIDVNSKEEVKAQIVKEEKYYSEGLTYADLSIKKMALEVSKSVEVHRLQRHDGRFVASLAGCGNKKRYN